MRGERGKHEGGIYRARGGHLRAAMASKKRQVRISGMKFGGIIGLLLGDGGVGEGGGSIQRILGKGEGGKGMERRVGCVCAFCF